jgi:hypothetical protein
MGVKGHGESIANTTRDTTRYRQETMLSMNERTAMGAVPRPVHGAVLQAVPEFYERFWSSGVHE